MRVAVFSLFLLGLFVWSGLLFWAIIVFFIAGTKSAPPLNDVTKLDNRRVAVGALAFVLLFLILTPVPHAFYQTLAFIALTYKSWVSQNVQLGSIRQTR